MTAIPPTIALVGSWADAVDERRSLAAELASSWPSGRARISVFTDTTDDQRARLVGARVWPEGAFGGHFTRYEFDHVILMIGARLDSILALARSADEGCHVWLQDDVVDIDGAPIDAPADWLPDVIASARSIIVGSDRLAGIVRQLAPEAPPVLVLPPAHPTVTPVVDTPERVIAIAGGDESVHQYLADTLSATLFSIDDQSVTSDVRERRLLAARVGVDFHTIERGMASTTVTHMMARGIPTITDLTAHAPFAGDGLTDTGLVVVDDLDAIADALRPVLDDDRVWLEASTAAKATAASWTWSDAADVLAQWIDTVDSLPRETVRVVGAIAS
ncbi:MAG: glycosyltransferase [Ilumatobacteraceae bacterium]